MFVLLKIFSFFLVWFLSLISKYVFKILRGAKPLSMKGESFLYKFVKQKKSTQHYLGMPLSTHARFKLTTENSTDSFFKRIGFSQEFQTGDTDFDAKVYIASDSLDLRNELSQDNEARKAILKIFSLGARYIVADGKHLVTNYPGPDDNHNVGPELATLRNSLKEIEKNYKPFLRDKFFWKAFFVEAFAWGLFSYGFMSIMEVIGQTQTTHIFWLPFFAQALILGLVFTAIIILLVRQFLRGSSRAHRVLIESALIFGVGFTGFGIGALQDCNEYYDKSPSVIIEADVTGKHFTVRRKRRGGKSYTYYIEIFSAQKLNNKNLPRSLRVYKDIYDQAENSDSLNLEIGMGYLNHPYLKNMTLKKRPTGTF